MLSQDIMTKPVITVRKDTPLEQVAQTMLDHRIGCVPVVLDDGTICGIVTDSDFSEKERSIPFSTFRAPQLLGQWVSPQNVERIFAQARGVPAHEIMSRKVVTVTESDPVAKVIGIMLRHDINRVPVVRDGVPVGIVARHDLLKMMADMPGVQVPDGRSVGVQT